jgi:hypothetical protein
MAPGPQGPSSPWALLAVPPVTLAAGQPWPPGGQHLAPGPPEPHPAAAAAAAAAAPTPQPAAAAALPHSWGPEGSICNRHCPHETSQRPPAAPCTHHGTSHGQQRPSPAVCSPHPPGAQPSHRCPAPAGTRSLWIFHLLWLRCSARPPRGSAAASLRLGLSLTG